MWVPTPSIVETVTRAVCIGDELDILPDLVDEIAVAGESPNSVHTQADLAAGIRELIDHLRIQAEAMTRLVKRLGRLCCARLMSELPRTVRSVEHLGNAPARDRYRGRAFRIVVMRCLEVNQVSAMGSTAQRTARIAVRFRWTTPGACSGSRWATRLRRR